MRKKDLDAELKSGIATEMMHVHRQLMQYGSRAMEKLNIGVGQMPILLLLDERKTMTQRQIAEEIRVTPATICGTLKRMEKSGLVRRTADSGDGRVSCVSLTETGSECSKTLKENISLPYGCLFDGFSGGELKQLKDFVERMGANLAKSLEDANEERE